LFAVPLVNNVASNVVVPAVLEGAWEDLTTALGVVEPNGTGALALYVYTGTVLQQKAQVIPPQGTLYGPYYDTNDPLLWDPNGRTGAAGSALQFGITIDAAASFTIVGPGTGQQATGTAPILAGAVTLYSVTLPPPTS
jgi:hypothetical protein